MVQAQVFSNEINSDGELADRLLATLQVRGQALEVDGDERFVQVGMPVYSVRYGRLIDFDTDGEEWARNLPGAYRNGAVHVDVTDSADPTVSARGGLVEVYADDLEQVRERA